MPNAPGKSHRKGISLLELFDMFPDEESATEWFERTRWPDGIRPCPRCDSERTHEVRNRKPMPFRCSDCRKYFSVRTGSVLEESRLPLRKWVIAIYLMATNLKGVSSMKLHRDLGVTQKTAWFMTQRIREAWLDDTEQLTGTVEVDETYIGGQRKNMHAWQRAQLEGRGTAGKAPIIGAKNRETGRIRVQRIQSADTRTVEDFVGESVEAGSTIYTDEHPAYRNLGKRYHHEAVRHSVQEYVLEQAHTNGIESFWSMLKRGYQGVYHKMSFEHLHRYAVEFAGRHNVRDLDTIAQMVATANLMVGKRLTYKALIGKE